MLGDRFFVGVYFCERPIPGMIDNGNMSVGATDIEIPIETLKEQSFLLKLVEAIFQLPFCLLLSPTCQAAVPFGTPMQALHSVSGRRMYLMKGSWNLLLCLSS